MTPTGPPEPTPEQIERESYAWVLLHAQNALYDKIAEKRELGAMIFYFLTRAALFSAIFGATMGFHARNAQTIVAAMKAPIFLLGTMAICLPALFSFNVLLGSRLSFLQTTSVLSLTTYIMAFVMGSLAPIQFLFVSSTRNKPFNFLLAVACSTIAGILAVRILWRAMEHLTLRAGFRPNPVIIRTWTIIYMVVGAQTAWLLRPWLGKPGEFAWFREIEGNFVLGVLEALRRLAGF